MSHGHAQSCRVAQVARTGGGGVATARAGVRRAFTLVELVITTSIIAIAAAMVIPTFSANDTAYLGAGVSLMIADLDFAQTTAISAPSEMALVRFDEANERWWVAPESAPNTPYTTLYGGEPYDTTMGVGRAESANGVTFSLVNVADGTIAYTAFGQVDAVANPTIVLQRGAAQSTIIIDFETGFLTTN